MRIASKSLFTILAASVLPLCISANAQDNAAAPVPAPTLRGFQLDPNRDTRRAEPEAQGPEIEGRAPQPARPTEPAPTPQAAPPVVVPTAPRTLPAPQRNPSSAPVPAPRAVPLPVPQGTPDNAAAIAPPVESDAGLPEATTPPPLPETAPATEPAITDPQPVDEAPDQLIALSPYILGGLLGLIAAIYLFRRIRRRDTAPDTVAPVEPEARPEPVTPHPPAPAPAPTPPPVAPPTPVQEPPAIPFPSQQGPRPWLTIDFEPLHARTTLIGVSIGYRLTIRNAGDTDITTLSLAARMANADAQQPQVLAEFFAEPIDQPLHSGVALASGATIVLEGALSLPHDALNAWRINDRVLFIPFIAFNVVYFWEGGHGGQTGQSYIIGRESTPPTDRMAPFRLDQGPREFRPVGARISDMAVRR